MYPFFSVPKKKRQKMTRKDNNSYTQSDITYIVKYFTDQDILKAIII